MTDDLHFDGQTYTIFGFGISREFMDSVPWIWGVVFHSRTRDEFIRLFGWHAWMDEGALAWPNHDHPEAMEILEVPAFVDADREARSAMFSWAQAWCDLAREMDR